MDAHLVTLEGRELPGSAGEVQALLGSSMPFWVDLAGTPDDDARALLEETFGFHPLAVEDAEHFGQRPKLDSYDDFALLVAYGVGASGQLIEVHCFCGERYLVTVHHDACPDLRDLADRLQRGGARRPADVVMLAYRVVDTLVDSFFPALAGMDDRIDDLEDQILERPTEEQLGRLFDLKRSLISLRKVVGPQRDTVAALLAGATTLPGMHVDAERYFRDLYDHLIRIGDLVDSYRDLLSGALDTHLSTVSNRLNVVMKQLTTIATVFLPLSFLTGFFGQNFSWMVNHLTGLPLFLGVGIGAQVVVVVGLVVLFRRRGWLGSDGMAPAAWSSARRRPSRR